MLAIASVISTPQRGTAQETESRQQSHRADETPAVSFQEILEYLGRWETDEGSWIDPSDLDWLLLPDQETENDEER